MAATAEAVRQELAGRVRHLAGPVQAGESVHALIRRVARRCGMQAGQIKRLWYQEWTVVPAHVADTLRALDEQLAENQTKNGNLQNEINRLRLAPMAPAAAVSGFGAGGVGGALHSGSGLADTAGAPDAASLGGSR